jgi:hypothetical protein
MIVRSKASSGTSRDTHLVGLGGKTRVGKLCGGAGIEYIKIKKIKKYYILKIVCMNFTKKRLKNYIDRYVMGLKRRE